MAPRSRNSWVKAACIRSCRHQIALWSIRRHQPPAKQERRSCRGAVARINVMSPTRFANGRTSSGCSTEQVIAAVTAVGNVAADVEKHLRLAGNASADRVALREAFEGQKPDEDRPSSSAVAPARAEGSPEQPPR